MMGSSILLSFLAFFFGCLGLSRIFFRTRIEGGFYFAASLGLSGWFLSRSWVSSLAPGIGAGTGPEVLLQAIPYFIVGGLIIAESGGRWIGKTTQTIQTSKIDGRSRFPLVAIAGVLIGPLAFFVTLAQAFIPGPISIAMEAGLKISFPTMAVLAPIYLAWCAMRDREEPMSLRTFRAGTLLLCSLYFIYGTTPLFGAELFGAEKIFRSYAEGFLVLFSIVFGLRLIRLRYRLVEGAIEERRLPENLHPRVADILRLLRPIVEAALDDVVLRFDAGVEYLNRRLMISGTALIKILALQAKAVAQLPEIYRTELNIRDDGNEIRFDWYIHPISRVEWIRGGNVERRDTVRADLERLVQELENSPAIEKARRVIRKSFGVIEARGTDIKDLDLSLRVPLLDSSASWKSDVDHAINPGKELDPLLHKREEDLPLVLMIVNSSMNTDLVKEHLKGHCRLIVKIDLEEGLASVSECKPDAVIADLALMSGSERSLCDSIRACDSQAYLPVLAVYDSRVSQPDLDPDPAADDYLILPLFGFELRTKIINLLIIRNLMAADANIDGSTFLHFDQEDSPLDRSRILRNEMRRIARSETMIWEDMEMAERFQRKMMNWETNISELDIFAYYSPLIKIGGDLYDIHQVNDRHLRIMLGDAAGHGINAALNSIRILSEYTLMRDKYDQPEEILRAMAPLFQPDHSDKHVTLFSVFIVDIDLDREEIRAASAGHVEQFLITHEQNIETIKPKGSLIGLPWPSEFNEVRMNFPAGSTLFLYTDGLLDSHRETGRKDPGPRERRKLAFNSEGLKKKLSSFRSDIELRENCETLVKELRLGVAKQRLMDDDLTFITIHRKMNHA